MIMANEYQLSYTAEEIDNKLGQVETINTDLIALTTKVSSISETAQSVIVEKEGNVITIIATLANGNVDVYTITIDDYKRPVSVVKNGAECIYTWLGFDDENE